MRKFGPLLLLEFSFFLGMWLSKTAWPLWFNHSGDMRIYGISYSVMALTGALSAGIGNAVRRIGISKSIRLGALLYMIGIGLRWFNQSLSAGVLSGILGGLGASTVLLALRTNARWAQDLGVSIKFLAARNFIAQAASGIAGLLVALLIAYGGHKGGNPNTAYSLAVFAGLAPLALVALFRYGAAEPPLSVRAANAGVSGNSHFFEDYRELGRDRRIRGLLLLSGLGGLYTSLSVPFFPVLFLQAGLSSESVAFMSSVAVAAGLCSQPLSAWLAHRTSSITAFVFGEAVFFASVACLLCTRHFAWIAFLVAARSFGRSMSLLSEEVIELKSVPREQVAVFYGLAQTLFLTGDSLGGAIGGFLVADFGVRATIATALALTAVHVVSMAWLIRDPARKQPMVQAPVA